ncbi:unannotated protein [freshwater metagenome]|uniref:Unannotated protein n=1 Tax=freshwater metagenome TaxID=449393 RepID=A0A6J7DAV4_9ZZZZ|nr:anti-sigma factor antagonist [Actinomycetota bacterium]
MSELLLETQRLGPDAALIAARGELSIGSAPGVAAEIGELVKRGRRRIIVDLDEVVFVDSTGLGFLLNGLRCVDRVDGRLVLVVPPGHVHRVFEMTRLDGVFRLAATLPEALGELGLAEVAGEA